VHGCAIFKGDHTQMAAKLFNPHPVPDAAIVSLNFPTPASSASSCWRASTTSPPTPTSSRTTFANRARRFGVPQILLAAKRLGLKAKQVATDAARLAQTPLPALAIEKDGSFVILARVDEQKVLIQDPRVERPQVLSLAEFEARWSGELILFTSRASLAGELAKFDFSWFIPAVVKYRKLLGEVLLVSFVLQLFALVTPLVLPGGDGQGAGASRADHARRDRHRPAGGDGVRSRALRHPQLCLRPHHQPHRRRTRRAAVPPSAQPAAGLLPGAPRRRHRGARARTGEHPPVPHRQRHHPGARPLVLGGVHRA
jgi:hypothetical protein